MDFTKELQPTKRVYKKSELTRKKIYDASLQLMEEQGFQGATIREICERAEVSVGTFYVYFDTKSDILRDIYLRADSFFFDVLAETLEGKSCVEQLHIFIENYARLNVETGLNVVKVLFNPENEWFAQTRPMQRVLSRIIAAGQRESALRGDIDTDKIVEFIFCNLRGTCYSWCVSNAGFDLNERMMQQFPLLMDGLVLNEASK